MKKCAVFCPVKNETIFSKIWLNYYSQFFEREDIYFLDFGSNYNLDGCKIVKSDKNIFDAEELFSEIKRFHSELLKSYDFVIPTDVDEIIFHEIGLKNFIDNFTGSDIKCTGYEIIHMPNVELEYDPKKSILSQREFWFRNSLYYDKTLITNRTLDWTIGLHHCYNSSGRDDDNLFLLHLHRFDYNICYKRHLEYSKFLWSQSTIKNNYNWHYRIQNKEEFDKWYYSTEGHEIIQIPLKIKDILTYKTENLNIVELI